MNTSNRREFIKLMGTGAAALTLPVSFRKCSIPTEKPNIIFIMADDHAAHALSCYGSRINQTPNLDRIADEGSRFDNCFCTNSICAPSRASILTGLYSHEHGVIDNRTEFRDDAITFPEILRNSSYDTALFGKWHLKIEPRGFNYWSVLPGQGDYYNPDFIQMGTNKRYEGHVTEVITDQVMDWLQNRESTQPFCLLYQFKAPHSNFMPGLKYLRRYEDTDIPLPDTFFDDFESRSEAPRCGPGHTPRDGSAESARGRGVSPAPRRRAPQFGYSPVSFQTWYAGSGRTSMYPERAPPFPSGIVAPPPGNSAGKPRRQLETSQVQVPRPIIQTTVQTAAPTAARWHQRQNTLGPNGSHRRESTSLTT